MRLLPISRAARLATAACLTLTLAGCFASGKTPIERQLPPAPAYLAPVDVANPRRGEDALAVAARERGGRVQANGRIVKGHDWYECVRENYARGAEGECR